MSGRHYTDSDEKGSSSSSSRSPSPHKVRRQRRHRRRKDSNSSSSSSSSSTSSRSNSLSRSKSKSKSKSRSRSPQRPLHRDDHKRKENDPASEVVNRKQTKCSDEENKRENDDSRRSDKAIKPSAKDDTRSTPSTVCAVALVDVPKAPPPPRISKTAIQFGKPGTVARPGIHMKLNAPKPKAEPAKKITVASAFNNDSDEEVEEMPAECKMRMRNIGRDTPTSSGPNSFGKTKQGFIDSKKLFEKSLREACME